MPSSPTGDHAPLHFDVLIVGAGLSGIGAAVHLHTRCPGKRYAILEGRQAIGGTWDLFRYPGIRSDSDMHTFGYGFKPWRDPKAIADGASILAYLKEAAAEYGVDAHIRCGHRVVRAAWSSIDATWTVDAEHDGQTIRFTCRMLLMCAGYYSYRHGHSPEFAGAADFTGTIVHPQAWPESLDYSGKRVVVIGSGATAVTLVPALAKQAAHVVMLQRSPSYVMSHPDVDTLAITLRKALPERWAYAITRWKNIREQQHTFLRSRRQPERMKQQLVNDVRQQLGPDYDVETHFTPRYNPWDQRLCVVPNGDLFTAIRSGRASVVTDTIERFTQSGVRLASGQTLDADIIVTATGLDLVVLGEIAFSVDGAAIDIGDAWAYEGMMYSDVPNLVCTQGYFNSSWTLRADLTAEYVCRLIQHMDAVGARQVTPRLRPADHEMTAYTGEGDALPGYVRRMLHRLPKQGNRAPWFSLGHYARDKKRLRTGPVADDVLEFRP